MTRIVLLDDHAILRDGIKHLLENEGDLSVVAECERPSQLQPLIERHAPDLLIIDLNMPEGGGFPLLQRIRPAHPQLRIIVLSMHENAGFVAKALSYGVHGYITKTVAAEELVQAIRAVTAEAAWQLRSEHEIGSLEAGKLADFVILNKDPRRVDPERIKDIAVLETWMDGQQVFSA